MKADQAVATYRRLRAVRVSIGRSGREEPLTIQMRSIRYASRMRRTLALSVFLAAFHGAGAGAFSFEDVAERAQLQARQPYRNSNRKAPAQLQALTYDQYRDIRFRPARALWRWDKLPFELMFFHLGKFQKEAVRIEEVTPQGTRHVAYRASDFDFGKNKLSPQSWGDLGYGGFRAHYPLNSSAYKDEVVVFLGASYFRALGAGPALRPVGARPGDRYRRRSGRGVSRLHAILGREARRRCHDADDLRAARFAARDGRISI